jgi:predicted O-methyltransferase YrrM
MPTWADVLSVPGFSSAAIRSTLNTSVKAMQPARILEVGSYMGSTAVAMCHENIVEVIHMVDNHSEFGQASAALAGTVHRFGLPAVLHDMNWFHPLPDNVFGGDTFNVYFYDGSHGEEDHARELAIALPYLEESFLYMVDDFTVHPHVARGCESGLKSLSDKVEVVSRMVYESKSENNADGYWNGLLVAWCRKK